MHSLPMELFPVAVSGTKFTTNGTANENCCSSYHRFSLDLSSSQVGSYMIDIHRQNAILAASFVSTFMTTDTYITQ